MSAIVSFTKKACSNNMGIKRKWIIGVLLCSFAACTYAQEATLTLNKSIETALTNNLSVNQSEVLAQRAAINLQQAKYDRLPFVDGQFNYGFNNGRNIDPFTNGYITQQLTSSNAGAQASLTLFNGMLLKNIIRQNSFLYATANMEWQQRKDELTLQVILAYLQILNNEDALNLARRQAAVTKQQTDRLEIIAKEGATPPGNLSDLKGQYAGDELTIITAQNNLETSVLALAQLMNVPYDASLKIERSGFDDAIKMYDTKPEDIYTTALEKLASVKASELRVKSSSMAIKVATAGYYPAVSLYGSASTNYSSAAAINKINGVTDVPSGDYVKVNGADLPVITRQNNFSTQKIAYGSQFNNNIATGYGVSVRVPFFSSFTNRSNVRLAKNEEKTNRLIADNIKLLLKQAIEQAYINITTSFRRYNMLMVQANAYAESFRIAGVRFESGVIDAPEYLITKNNLERTKATIINAKYEYLLRMKVLDFYMGRL